MVGMNFAHLFLGLHNLYIHLSIFFSHFLSYFNDSMSYDGINYDMSYWAIGKTVGNEHPSGNAGFLLLTHYT